MKKTIFMLLSAYLATINLLNAQSIAHFYPTPMAQPTMAENASSGLEDYFMTETTNRPPNTNGYIHAVRYDHNGNIMVIGTMAQDFLIADFAADAKNVDLTQIGTDTYLQTSYYRHLTDEPNRVRIRLMLLRLTSTGVVVLAENIISSMHPDFNSFYALDAAYDKNNARFIICGMAVADQATQPTDSKEAFVMTVDASLTPILVKYYNSVPATGRPPIWNNYDGDFANRVVVTSSGNYYITGGQNGSKNMGGGFYYGRIVMRNMLIDPTALDISTPGTWDTPLTYITDEDEIGADMLEINGAYVSLVNGLINMVAPIDPTSGAPLTPQAYYVGNGFLYSITKDFNSDNVFIHGIQHRYQPDMTYCATYLDNQAEPFVTILDMTTPTTPAFVSETEYRTAIGNSAPGADFWTANDAYAPMTTYSRRWPIYYNRFAEHTGAAGDFGIIAPIHYEISPGNLIVNNKFIFTDNAGATDCPILDCEGFEELVYTQKAESAPSYSDYYPELDISEAEVSEYNCYGTPVCGTPDFYYKTANNSSNPDEILNNLLSKQETSVYPNPATNEIKIELADDYISDVSISLCDITGKKVADIYDGVNSHQAITYTIPEGIANGIYHLNITSKGQQTTTYKVNIMR